MFSNYSSFGVLLVEEPLSNTIPLATSSRSEANGVHRVEISQEGSQKCFEYVLVVFNLLKVFFIRRLDNCILFIQYIGVSPVLATGCKAQDWERLILYIGGTTRPVIAGKYKRKLFHYDSNMQLYQVDDSINNSYTMPISPQFLYTFWRVRTVGTGNNLAPLWGD